jgi:hypothetical protein
MTQRIAVTIGSHNGHIIARAKRDAEKNGMVQLMDFVRIGRVIGRTVRIEDAHDFGSDTEISRLAGINLTGGLEPTLGTKNSLYKKIHIEALGEILPGGELSEYTGGIGYFEDVTQTNSFDIARLYPCPNGITIGNVASGWKTTQVPFKLSLDNALTRHMLVVGKNGSGKTNFLKELIAANVTQNEPVAMLVFGHPDLGADNPSDRGTRGVTALENDKVITVGFDRTIKLSPQEIGVSDIFEQFPDMSTSMRDLWYYMQSQEPNRFINILATYDLTNDPLKLIRATITDKKTKQKKAIGVATVQTIDAVCKQARIINNYIDSNAAPVVSQILGNLKRGKSVLVNTFNMTDYYQGLFVRLILGRLQKAGKHAMHRNISQRILVVIDEAQHFIKRAGSTIAEFVMECRKFGITLVFSTQTPKSIPENVYGQIYSTIAFHLNRADAQALLDVAPALSEAKNVILRPPLKRTMGTAIVQALGYPYPAVIRVPHFERRFENKSIPENNIQTIKQEVIA